jgi:hypothetical protein
MDPSAGINALLRRMEGLLAVISEPEFDDLDAYATRLAELEHLAAARVADLMAPGQVVLKLAVKGFGVRLRDA